MRLVKIDTTGIRRCAKCHRSDLVLFRHHKGFDSLLGLYNKGIGCRYHEFKDCVLLCLEHHGEIHYIYRPYVDKWVNRTPTGARHFRKILIKVCDHWLAGKIPSPKVPRIFVRQFEKSLRDWKAENG